MANTEAIMGAISDRGLKMKYIASELGISVTSLWRKIRGMTEFKPSEIVKMCDLLGIKSSEETERFFLCRQG